MTGSAPLVERLRPHRFTLALVALWLVHAVVNAMWLAQDMSLSAHDAAPHLEAQAHLYALLTREGPAGLWKIIRNPGPGWWPTAGYLPWVMIALVLGHSLFVARLSNLLYLAVLLWATFDLGRRLHSRLAGALAATLLSLFPVVFGESRQFGVDLPSAALIALSLALLLRTERLSRFGWSLAFGASVGLGVLVRPQVLMYVVPSACAVLALALVAGPTDHVRAPTPTHSARLHRLRPVIMAAMSGATAALLSSVWWYGHLHAIRTIFAEHQRDAAMLSLDATPNVPYYARMLPWALNPLMVLLALWGAVCLARRLWGGAWRHNDAWVVTATWLVGGVATLLSIHVHFLRFLLPICPPLALTAAVALVDLRRPRLRWSVVGAVLALMATVWMILSWVPESARFFGPGTRPRGMTNTAPRINKVLFGAKLVADELSRTGLDGPKIRVHLVAGPRMNKTTLFWMAGPMLRIPLPGIELTGQHYMRFRRHKRGVSDMRIGGASLPLLNSPNRKNFVLTFDNAPRSQVTGFGRFTAVRVLDLEVNHPLVRSLTLWRLDRKPNRPER